MTRKKMRQNAATLIFLGWFAGAAFGQALVRIDGSSTVYPITEAVAEEFMSANPGMQVVVGISGTGGGFKKFYRGETDLSNASRPIQVAEMEECKKAGIEYIELPIAFDALTVMVNPANTFVESMTIEDLRTIWSPEAQGKILKWNQVRSEWPDQPLALYGAGTDSGTFDYFTEAVTGKAKSSRGDFTASEDDNVLVQGVSKDKNALGYFGFAYYIENQDKLKAVPIVNHENKPVLPSEASVMDGSYTPLSRPIFIYVNRKSLDRPEVRKFVEFYLKEGPALTREVRYVPLPAGAYKAAMERVAKGQIGTAYGGHSETGLHIDELLKRPLSTEPRK
ncbi:MAG: PstS family phosphate ABC transporter substrate-binding protein [Phycisphaerae bacterium]|nr:MAG: PstS family phosphate ABC transporter substrate-binding protein [Planctomycetota bacterium]KAB2941689.1 MAG: PstS family phosphate ABC transporter substrate-binding protein [Phycisphaerae bacterium]MBE7455911.1 PstS family phosphate ABC transporter substrate-binding protein [Planctomycetia bacterium]MCL4717169.1 PstS family phosphate ABC transporter substrate-binding protein [Phycisphaerae bacterium]MCQ3919662.1 protein sphX [Planctomycetota bacterium]